MPSISGIPDAVSDVLSLVRMSGEMVCANEFSAPWSFRFGRKVAHFHMVEKGSAWLRADGQAPRRMEIGDLVVLPHGTGHALSSSPELRSKSIEKAASEMAEREGAVYKFGEGGVPTHVICGQFTFAGTLAPKLLTVLPKVIHIPASPGRSLEWLRLTAHFLVEETRTPRPGSAIMVKRLLDMLFIQAVRAWATASQANLGWLSGLKDEHVGRALSVIHAQPAHAWTVESLAEQAGMSRSAFASRFTALVGLPPLKYLTQWRLDLAADQLRTSSDRIAAIAEKVGYSSEAALNRAFKTQFRTTPAAFRKVR